MSAAPSIEQRYKLLQTVEFEVEAEVEVRLQNIASLLGIPDAGTTVVLNYSVHANG